MIDIKASVRQHKDLAKAREEQFDPGQARRTQLAAQARKSHTIRQAIDPFFLDGGRLDSLGPVPARPEGPKPFLDARSAARRGSL